ncbi:MAG: hypothetical protein OSB67_06915 [Alphaproteobacteria bacterium]|nr:hypothetical protein [Alphaproteobacteria bacterium]
MKRRGFLAALGGGTIAAMAADQTVAQYRRTISLSGKRLYLHAPPKT